MKEDRVYHSPRLYLLAILWVVCALRLLIVCVSLTRDTVFVCESGVDESVKAAIEAEVRSLQPDLVRAPGLTRDRILRNYFKPMEHHAFIAYHETHEEFSDVFVVTVRRNYDKELEWAGPSRMIFSRDFKLLEYNPVLPRPLLFR